jgi:hypothetical protein
MNLGDISPYIEEEKQEAMTGSDTHLLSENVSP